jgi:hypothetical protein
MSTNQKQHFAYSIFKLTILCGKKIFHWHDKYPIRYYKKGKGYKHDF